MSYRQETAYGAHLVLEVQDSGIGMDKKAIRKLFEPFVQADASTTRNYGGTGLGLTITRQLTRFMGGSIQVESSPGQGTTFKLHFPLFEDTTDDFDPMTQQIVLLIEDDPMIQDLVRRQLSHTSYRVVVADNGKEGLLMAQSLEPQAIILDVIMPQMDGWTTLKNIRQHPKLAQIPILMVSGQEAMPEDHLLALRVDDFLLKPIQRDTLIAALERLLAPSIPGPHDILVIDDNPDVRNIVRRSLEREGWSIAEAENGKQGLEMLQEAKYDLILLDLLMPEMDGFTFLAHAQPKYPQIPIVVLTAKELTMDERRLLAKNTASLLQKGRTTGKDIQNILATLLRS